MRSHVDRQSSIVGILKKQNLGINAAHTLIWTLLTSLSFLVSPREPRTLNFPKGWNMKFDESAKLEGPTNSQINFPNRITNEVNLRRYATPFHVSRWSSHLTKRFCLRDWSLE
jgi:hypothetical protein